MAVCRVCSATLTDNPAEVNGSYGESRSGITLLESQVSKALGESLCTYHWMQVLEGNDNTAMVSVTDNSMADTLHRHSELSASDGTPDAIVSVDSDGILYADAAPVGFDILYSGVIGAHLTVGNNIIVGGTVDGVDIAARDHAKYLDAEALAAAVQSGAITNAVTKAPTHDAVFDVKTTADGAIAKSLLTTRGDIIYRNATVPARLAKGTEGHVLTMGASDPAWAAAAGGEVAWTLLETLSPSGAATISSGTLTAQDMYMVVIRVVCVYTSSEDLIMRLNGDTDSDYSFQTLTTTTLTSTTGTNRILIGEFSAGGNEIAGVLYLPGTRGADVIPIIGKAVSDSSTKKMFIGGQYAASANITSFTFLGYLNGTITGKIEIWGRQFA